MAKKKEPKVKSVKGPPKTIRVWLPVHVVLDDEIVHARGIECDEVEDAPTEVDREMCAQENGQGENCPNHVVWVEAVVPVPQPRLSVTVEGKVT